MQVVAPERVPMAASTAMVGTATHPAPPSAMSLRIIRSPFRPPTKPGGEPATGGTRRSGCRLLWAGALRLNAGRKHAVAAGAGRKHGKPVR